MRLLVSHDAGGAELLSSMVRADTSDCLFALAGPALGVFRRKLGEFQNLTLEQGMSGATELVCGTSWQSDLEFEALGRARELGIPSRVFLDHWVNYRDRFERDGKVHLPDEIWTADDYAKSIAAAQFPGMPIRMIGNPYLGDIAAELALLPTVEKDVVEGFSVLYVCEPVSEVRGLRPDTVRPGYDEFEALRFFLDNVDALGGPVRRIAVRPHPAELPDKYDRIGVDYRLPIVRGGGLPLIEEISRCDIVVGCESMAMVIGLAAKKRVVCSIPPGGRPCQLPFKEIESLRRP